MKHIKQSNNNHHWPRHEVKSVECRRKDLVLRISDWSRDKDEPAFDVECYIGGVYDFNESKSFTKFSLGNMKTCKSEAIKYAQQQIAKLL